MRRDLQVGKGFIVLLLLVMDGLDVLDQPGFEKQRIHFTFAFHEINIGDFVNPPGNPGFQFGRFLKIAAGPRA